MELKHPNARIIMLFISIGMATSTHSNSTKAANEEAVNIKQSYDLLMKAAVGGNAEAQYALGRLHQTGTADLPPHYQEAKKWYLIAAEAGHPGAQTSLGYLYNIGIGIAQNYAEAVRWYTKAAMQGVACAQFNLGYMYQDGHGVQQSYTEAYRWFLLAAKAQDADAQFSLALLYSDGKGVKQNYQEAFRWYSLAAHQDHAGAHNNLAILYEKGTGTEMNYAQAIHHFTQAASKGIALAQGSLGRLYACEKKYHEAFLWLTQAAEQNQEDSQYNLAIMYCYGYGVPKNIKRAIEWCTKSANKEYSYAQIFLAELLQLKKNN